MNVCFCWIERGGVQVSVKYWAMNPSDSGLVIKVLHVSFYV